MIGAEAGCRHPDRVPAYLNNLYRLGLIWFSREPLEDPLRYQVLEAQPEVLEAMGEAGPRPHRAPQHPPDAVRRGLLPRRLPADTVEFDAVVETHSARDVDGAESRRESASDDGGVMPDPVPPNPEPLGRRGRGPLMGESTLSLWSEDSALSIASRGSLLSIGSVGSVLSVGSVGSAASAFSVGSAASLGSALSAASIGSLMSGGGAGAVLGEAGAARRRCSARERSPPRR